MKDWIDAHGLLDWLEGEGVTMTDAHARHPRLARALRRWREGQVVNVYSADRILTELGTPLALVPDELYRDAPQGRRRIAPEIKARGIEMAREGKAPSEICRELGVSAGAVYAWRREAGLLEAPV